MSYVLPTRRGAKGLNEAEQKFVEMEARNAAKRLMEQHAGKNLYLLLLGETLVAQARPLVDHELKAGE